MSTVAILGIGASGIAAAHLALSQGSEVHVSDLQTDASAAARAADLRRLGADVELGTHDVDRIAAADVIVASPGIPPTAPVLRDLRARGRSWIAEPEFAVRFLEGTLIAVTGTNGKTTASVLIAHLLKRAGVDVALGGNVGGGFAPAASMLPIEHPEAACVVLEMSSFQLADIVDFCPDVGVLLGLAPDHLDRYASVADYYGDKARLFMNATAASRWILNGDQPEVLELAGDAAGHRHLFSISGMDEGAPSPPHTPAAWVADGVLRVDLTALDLGDGPVDLITVSDLPLLGRHNVANALAAALAALLGGASVEGVRDGLRTATALRHRLQPVGESRGVLWVNDSKATNVSATVSAVTSLSRPIVLLLGGKDKGEDLAPLIAVLDARVRAVICYGAAGVRFADALTAAMQHPERLTLVEGGMDDAVSVAREVVQSGDVLLLSPACSSFDEFRNYEERGARFAALAGEAA